VSQVSFIHFGSIIFTLEDYCISVSIGIWIYFEEQLGVFLLFTHKFIPCNITCSNTTYMGINFCVPLLITTRELY